MTQLDPARSEHKPARNQLEPDRDEIEKFVDCVFRHVFRTKGMRGVISIRSFYEDTNKVFRLSAAELKGGSRFIVDVAVDDARRAAQFPNPIVFCPPLAVFADKDHAMEKDIIAGLTISVECDAHPQEARERLEKVLGDATCVVESGGRWTNGNGEVEAKLHWHLRLAKLARPGGTTSAGKEVAASDGPDDLAKLKQCRELAARLVGADTSNVPVCHPIRWPGSWHRKAEPRLCKIIALNPDREIDLDTALAALKNVTPQPTKPNGGDTSEGSGADWGELIGNLLAGRNLHDSIKRLAAKHITAGMSCGAAVNQLRALMKQSTARTDRPNDWEARYDDIPRAVDTAWGKYGPQPEDKPPPPPPPEDKPLDEMNRDNCVILDGAKAWVLRFDQVSHKLNGRRYSYRVPLYLRPQDFRLLYMNRFVKIGHGAEAEFVTLGNWWLRHAERRQYLGVVFEPASELVVDGKLNLWTGWGVEPRRGDWGLMRKHVREVLAASDEGIDTYIINWLAWAVQHPDQQPETALVFLGKRGSGRGTLGNAMCRIFGNHALHISSPDHLVGRFNEHLRQCGFLFADEAYAVADRKTEGTLKRLITEGTIMIEGKGKGVITAPNHLHVMMASNEDWVVPAGEIERRFEVLEVANEHAQENGWFKPLYEQLNAGGVEAMLYDLLHRDLGNWHPRQIIRTPALAKQQEESLSPFDAWWIDLLHSGFLPAGDATGQVISGDYQARISDGFRTDNTLRTRFEKRKGLYEQARTASPGLKRETDAAFGRYLRKRGCKRKRVCRQRGWQIPTLDQCRTEWKKRFPDTAWDEAEVTCWAGGLDDDDVG